MNSKYYIEMMKFIRPQSFANIYNYLRYKILPKRPYTPCSSFCPSIVHLNMISRCNLRCEYCNTSKQISYDAADGIQEMTFDRVQKIFQTPLLRNSLFVDLLGGEPLLVADIERIVVFLSKQGKLTNISTNGLLLPKKIASLKNAGISRINVSLYPTNIKFLSKELEYINNIFPCHTSFVLVKSQLQNDSEEIYNTIEFARKAKSKSLRLWMYRPMGLNADVNEVVTDDLPEYKKFYNVVKQKFGDFVIFPSVLQKSEKKLCRQPWQHMGIDYLGRVSVCCGIDEPLDESFNIFTTPSDDIYNAEFTMNLRRQLLDPHTTPKQCINCNLLYDPGW